MSKDWTPEELSKVSAAMEAAGYMSIEQIAALVGTLPGRKALLEVYEKNPAHPDICPRCGHYVADCRKALSRRANISICDRCGVKEALRDFARAEDPIEDWDFFTRRREVTEFCPECEEEVTLCDWNIWTDGLQVICPECGHTLMLCSACDRSPCDWDSEKGCKHSRPAL